ncbi:ROK family protein [Corynebacterium yudongzhengii]|uniref:ROK family protein n=1 Tax=Corynebacterium yudongzhengii TaxID=2080740 RepID=A0A2U1T402_9CORY|nr:ROK family protein [Corynebacterium yudongzhengii]AWB82372.1 ROK family protein [Corynebacterium yudongzhengii]PWC00712.1 ROK family protein [Corynebacterium yudongzhengii]
MVDPASGTIVDASPTIPGWAGTDLGALMREVAPGTPVAIHNDVRTWAYGEHHLIFGEKLADERVLYVALGTGAGGAIIDQGQLLRSPRLRAGEIAELMACDFRGIADRAENIASGESLARYYNELHLNPELSGPIGWRERREGDVDLAEVLRRSEAGDELASEIIAGNLRGFGAALAGLAHAADIGAIVFGGGVTGIGPVVTRALRAGLEEWLHATKARVDCYFTSLPHPAPILAAALYAVHHAE